MSATHRIGALVTRIQNEFLDTPGLALTVHGATRRLRIGTVTCRALLDVLVDARVLRNRAGVYVRYFPSRVPRRTAPEIVQYPGRRTPSSGSAPRAGLRYGAVSQAGTFRGSRNSATAPTSPMTHPAG
jgi:hypothetical protein